MCWTASGRSRAFWKKENNNRKRSGRVQHLYTPTCPPRGRQAGADEPTELLKTSEKAEQQQKQTAGSASKQGYIFPFFFFIT